MRLYTTAPVQQFISDALRRAVVARTERGENVADLVAATIAQYNALPAPLQPVAVGQLRTHAATGTGYANESADALRVLDWVVTGS